MIGRAHVDAPSTPLTLDEPSRGLVPGQRVIGRVLEVLASNQFLLAVGGERLRAQSAVPLVPGQEVALDVVNSGTGVEMRLVSTEVPSTPVATAAEHTLALAALVTAARAGAEGGAAPGAGAFLKALDALVKSGGLTATKDVQALVRTLAPQSTEGDAASLALRLRTAYENGGQLFEAHLRTILEAHPGLSDQQALERVRNDARLLMGRAAASLTTLADADTAASAGAQLEAVASHVLTRQIQSGMHWLADGTVTVKVPVQLPSGSADAEVTFRREPESTDADVEERSPGFNVRFRVNSELLGAVDASVSWRGPTLNTTLSVVNADAKELLQPELPALERGLRETFPEVHASLVVDPGRVHATAVSEKVPEIRSGSLVNVRA